MTEKFFRSHIRVNNLPNVVRAKWDNNLLNEGVVPLPKLVMRHMAKVFKGEKALEKMLLIIAVADFKRPNYGALPSVEYLAYTAGLTPERFTELLNEMRNEELLEYELVEDRIKINTKLFEAKVGSLHAEEIFGRKGKNDIPF